MKSLKAVFKNGVFVPLENVSLKEGDEVLVVYNESEDQLAALNLSPLEKEAIKELSNRIKHRIVYKEIKACKTESGFEIFIIVEANEFESVKEVMKQASDVYKEYKVHIPIQVVSTARLKKWKEQENQIYKEIVKGTDIG